MDAFTFRARMDSKGRVTVPARIREKLGIDRGGVLHFAVLSVSRVTCEVEGPRKALEVIEDLESVQSFSYSDGSLEVFLDV